MSGGLRLSKVISEGHLPSQAADFFDAVWQFVQWSLGHPDGSLPFDQYVQLSLVAPRVSDFSDPLPDERQQACSSKFQAEFEAEYYKRVRIRGATLREPTRIAGGKTHHFITTGAKACLRQSFGKVRQYLGSDSSRLSLTLLPIR
jgi:hypothetical protein